MTLDRSSTAEPQAIAAEDLDAAAPRPLPDHGRRVMVIYNPVAGFRRRRRFNAVLRRLARLGCPLTVRETAGHGEAEELARAALGGECDVVVSAGGDGTLNEVANAVAGSGVAVGLIPLGTANVVAAEIGLDASPAAVAETIAHGRPRRIHLGRAGDRLFCAMAGAGLDARIVADINYGLKRRLGKGAYVWAGLKQFATLPRTTYEVAVGGEARQAVWVIAANAHYYGGRFVSAPEARLDDPVLHLVLLTRRGRWNLLRYAGGLLLDRLHALDDVAVIPTRSFTLAGPADEPLQADGDLIGRLPVEVAVADRTLSLLVPG